MTDANRNGRATFVLVHGAWAGSWSMMRVADVLMARGHRVFAPTLSGLGERSHLAGANINLTTHVDDVVNEVVWKDLDNIVLVGHSYSGLVITGVAERIGERIASIVYLDAFIPADGQSFADFAEGWELVGETIPAPPTSKGDYLDEEDRAWVDAKATPHPTASLKEKLRVTGAYQRVPKKTYIQATGWESPFGETADALGKDPGWTVRQIACGHDVGIDKPQELADLLVEAA